MIKATSPGSKIVRALRSTHQGHSLLRTLASLRDSTASLLAVLNRHAASGLRGKVAIYVIGGSSLLAFCAALAVLDAERRNSEANIIDFGDAMWWSITTMTTVGDGDEYPTTRPGRLVATVLMVASIALLGTVTATLASWLVDHVRAEEECEVSDLRTGIEILTLKIDQLLSTTQLRGAATGATLTATAEPSELRSSP
jgi:voltage-gated potassium channel